MGHSKIISRPSPILRKQMGQMAKLFGLWENSKLKDSVQRKINPDLSLREGVPEFLSQTRGVRTRSVTRRQIVLNRHFTEIVSDVLAINFGKELQEWRIRITSIETKAWNKGVRIFYVLDGSYDEQVHKKLVKLEPSVRYAISERRLIGRTPLVNFVYDSTMRFDEVLNETLANTKLEDSEEKKMTDLILVESNQLYSRKDVGSKEEKLVSRKFFAPPDMDNTLLGLNYPELYDEVAENLARGRGDASRMIANTTYLTYSKPLFREALRDDGSAEDPTERLQSMKRFLINQKLKAAHMSRIRRKEELLSMNKFRWTQNSECNEDVDEKVAPDFPEEDEIS